MKITNFLIAIVSCFCLFSCKEKALYINPNWKEHQNDARLPVLMKKYDFEGVWKIVDYFKGPYSGEPFFDDDPRPFTEEQAKQFISYCVMYEDKQSYMIFPDDNIIALKTYDFFEDAFYNDEGYHQSTTDDEFYGVDGHHFSDLKTDSKIIRAVTFNYSHAVFGDTFFVTENNILIAHCGYIFVGERLSELPREYKNTSKN